MYGSNGLPLSNDLNDTPTAIAFLFSVIALAYSMDDDANAKMMMHYMKNDGQHFKYGFDLSNGIGADETGNEMAVQGEYHYVTKGGVPVKVTYVADETGYHPQSDMIPTPPPTPAAILRALEYIKTHSKKHDEVYIDNMQKKGY